MQHRDRTGNFNSLDIWAWCCRFEDCAYGLYNGAGNFHVYESTFVRSTEADVSTQHCGYFSFYRNTSIGSKAFYLGKRHPMWKDNETHPAQVAIQENTFTPVGTAMTIVAKTK